MELQYEIFKKVEIELMGKTFTVLESPYFRSGNIYDSFEEAVEVLKNEGNDLTEYTVIPRIYNTSY